MITFLKYLIEDSDRPVTWHEIDELTKYLDSIWEKLGIEFEFSQHFLARVNDERNKKQITISELQHLFTEVYKLYGQQIAGKVTPESEQKFDSVLTDLSTNVNSPVVVEWDKKKKELKMVVKTVMRVPKFFTHPNQSRLIVQDFKFQDHFPINNSTMKTYTLLKEWLGELGVNTPVGPISSVQAVDDVDSAAFSVEQSEILDKLNAYCKGIVDHTFLNPYYPLNMLWKKLNIIGLNFDLKSVILSGDSGRVEVPMTQFGGTYGVLDNQHNIGSSDGISNRVPGGLKLVVTFTKIGGLYTLNVAIESGASSALNFGEEQIVSEVKNSNDLKKK